MEKHDWPTQSLELTQTELKQRKRPDFMSILQNQNAQIPTEILQNLVKSLSIEAKGVGPEEEALTPHCSCWCDGQLFPNTNLYEPLG